MSIAVFDTETTSLNKPFCYNIGYIIFNPETYETLEREYVIEQVWHNLPLFSTAYYANKRPLYVERMRAHKIRMEKFGYICQQMIRDFRNFEVTSAYAYNSSFDERVFEFNCDWFKCINPFDDVPIYDIRGYAHNFLMNKNFKEFCEAHNRFTDSGNYSTTAETMFQYITNDTNFSEEHTALNDSKIELQILLSAINKGASLNTDYKAERSIERKVEKTLHVHTAEQNDYYFNYEKIRINKDKTEVILK